MNVLSPEQHPSTIFRDIMKQEFVIKTKEAAPVLVPPEKVELQDYFYMLLSSKSEKLSRFFLQLSEGRIYLRMNPESPVLAYVDIDYSRIKLMKPTPIMGRQLAVVRFIKGKTYEDILHEDSAVTQAWFEALKKTCILSKFREHYKVGSIIGKGNFAKVIACVSLDTNEEYAVKIFDKKLILQDKFERVGWSNLAMSSVRTKDDESSELSKSTSNFRNIRRRQQHLLCRTSLQRSELVIAHPRQEVQV